MGKGPVMGGTPSERHNAILKPLLASIIDATTNEAEQWVVLESLCLGIGLLHQRPPRHIAEFIEIMAERIASGERQIGQSRGQAHG
jgi:hypothetical protein